MDSYQNSRNLSEHLIAIDDTIQMFIGSASYVFPFIGTICTLLNFSVLVLLIRIKLKKEIYSFIKFRLCIKGLFALFISFSTFNRLSSNLCWFCKSTQYNTIPALVIGYASDVVCDIFAHIIGLIELSITFDKLCILINKSYRLSKNIVLVSASIIGFSIAVVVPKFFILNLEPVDGDIHKRVQSTYNSVMYNYYFFGLYIMDICLLCVYLVFMIIVCVMYRAYSLKKEQLTSNKKRRLSKKKLTNARIIIINGIIYMTAAFLFIIGNLLAKLEEMGTDHYGPLIIIRYASYYLALVLSLGVSPIVVLYYDKNIRRCLVASEDKKEEPTIRTRETAM